MGLVPLRKRSAVQENRRGSGRPQGIAPTVVAITLGRLIRTTVGAIPCGCPEPRLKKQVFSGKAMQLSAWLLCWEIYLIVLLASFLRLYGIEASEFDADQANIFHMAYGALQHGLLVATANTASIGIMNPPGIIYLLMTTAAWSVNPLWAAVMQAVSSIIAVVLTYVFVRRYYGRLAGTFAALLFATAERAVFYARFIWQQNLIPFFLLFFLLALFWGVVERRKGWLFPALFLWGLLLQLHATAGLLLAPFLIAILLSPGTIRWRDVCLGLLSLLIIYAPYLLWEISSQFYDVRILLEQPYMPSQVDNLAITYYQFFVTPYTTVITESQLFANTNSVLFPYFRQLSQLTPLFSGLVIAGAVMVLVQAAWPRATGQAPTANVQVKIRVLQSIVDWWATLLASPYRCGLWVLLVWQVVPLLLLSRHTLPIYPHYLIILMPGQYIFIGLFLANVMRWVRGSGWWRTCVRYAAIGITCLLIVSQCVGSTGTVMDFVRGNYPDTALSASYYNDLHSLQSALRDADRLAQQHHLDRVYIGTDLTTQSALAMLSEQMRTRVTLFDSRNCLVLPGVQYGPAVMLVGPRSALTVALLQQFAQATLVGQPKRLGGPPFQLYIVSAVAQSMPGQEAFRGHLQVLDPEVRTLVSSDSSWFVTHWELQHAVPPAFRVTYGYNFTAQTTDGYSGTSECSFSTMRVNDQLVAAFSQDDTGISGVVSISAQFGSVGPRELVYGPLRFETDLFAAVVGVELVSVGGGKSVTLIVSPV